MKTIYVALCLVLIMSVVDSFMIMQSKLARMATSRNLFGSPSSDKPAPKKDGGGMFGNMGNIMDSMKKAQEIAKHAETLNKELSEATVVGSDPTGQVHAIYYGNGSPVSIKVSDSILGQGSEAVSIAASQAMVDAFNKSQQVMASRMQALYASAGLPTQPMK